MLDVAERDRQPEGRAERELRARDDGALHARRRPRCVHRARRARAGARADRLAEQLEPQQRRLQLPLRPEAARPRDEDRLPQGGPLRLAGRLPALRLASRLHASFFVNKLWSYFVPVPPIRATLAGLEALYRQGYEVAPVVGAILKHPALIDGPRMVKPPIVHQAGTAAPDRRRDHDDRLGVDRRSRRPAALLPAERRRAGTTRAGSTPRRTADAGSRVQRMLRDHQLDPAKPRRGPPPTPPALLAQALALLAQPGALVRHARTRCCTSPRRRCTTRAGRTGSSKQYPVLIENALRHLIAVSPDVQTS